MGAAVIPNSGLLYTIYANYFGDNLDVTDVLKIGGVLETGAACVAAEAAWTTRHLHPFERRILRVTWIYYTSKNIVKLRGIFKP